MQSHFSVSVKHHWSPDCYLMFEYIYDCIFCIFSSNLFQWFFICRIHCIVNTFHSCTVLSIKDAVNIKFLPCQTLSNSIISYIGINSYMSCSFSIYFRKIMFPLLPLLTKFATVPAVDKDSTQAKAVIPNFLNLFFIIVFSPFNRN